MRVELYVTAGPAKGKRFVFNKPDCFLFGRAKDAHVSLPNDLYVSRQHFFLEISPPDCKLRDLNSKNGVFVNGVRYGGRTPLKGGIKQAPINEIQLQHGDEIVVGDTRITVIIQDETGPNKIPPEQTSQAQRVLCALCRKDVTQELNNVDHAAETRYVCLSCRNKIVITHGTVPKKMFQNASGRTPSPQAFRSQLPQLEGFQFEQRIGKGTMGDVYKAREIDTGRIVAIKTFTSHFDILAEKMRLLHRELHVIQHLKHKHIVPFLGYKQQGKTLFFVFEFVEGITLRKLMLSHKGPVPLVEALPILLGTLNGLAAAHRTRITARTAGGRFQLWEGIVHRDLSPQHILLVKNGNTWFPKLTDFKLSRSLEAAGITSITSPEELLGAPMYWPREQLTHYHNANPATDVFSIAAIFYEMLTGAWIRDGFQTLFERCKQHGSLPSISDYMHVIASHPPVPIRKRNPELPKPLADVIDRGLREQELPHDDMQVRDTLRQLRYADAGEFRESLINAFKTMGFLKASKAVPSSVIKQTTPSPVSKAIMLSDPQPEERRELALLVLDVAESTKYIVHMGDTHFSTLIGLLFSRVKNHPLSTDLFSLKGTGDGFLAAFHSLASAYTIATTFLTSPVAPNIHVRMALHWGAVKIGTDGDILGIEVQRVSRMESLGIQDRVASEESDKIFPDVDRILMTRQGLEQLGEEQRANFTPIGNFRLPGFHELCQIWVLTQDDLTH